MLTEAEFSSLLNEDPFFKENGDWHIWRGVINNDQLVKAERNVLSGQEAKDLSKQAWVDDTEITEHELDSINVKYRGWETEDGVMFIFHGNSEIIDQAMDMLERGPIAGGAEIRKQKRKDELDAERDEQKRQDEIEWSREFYRDEIMRTSDYGTELANPDLDPAIRRELEAELEKEVEEMIQSDLKDQRSEENIELQQLIGAIEDDDDEFDSNEEWDSWNIGWTSQALSRFLFDLV